MNSASLSEFESNTFVSNNESFPSIFMQYNDSIVDVCEELENLGIDHFVTSLVLESSATFQKPSFH